MSPVKSSSDPVFAPLCMPLEKLARFAGVALIVVSVVAVVVTGVVAVRAVSSALAGLVRISEPMPVPIRIAMTARPIITDLFLVSIVVTSNLPYS